MHHAHSIRPFWTASALGALLCAGIAHADTQVFFTDFDSGAPSEISGSGAAESVQGLAGFGNAGNQFSGNLWRNDSVPGQATTLTLTGLGAHTSLSISFLLAAIDSWDSTNGSPSPDFFNVRVDGVDVFQATFANASGSSTYTTGNAFGDIYNGGSSLGWGSWQERAFDMSFEGALQNIAHTGSTAVIEFYASGNGWQGGIDESWGIDNLGVTINEIPAPGAAVLALGALRSARRRRMA